MPSRRAHRYYSRQLFGRDFDDVHQAMDSPSRWLGPSHRRIFHSYVDAAILAMLVSKDPDAPRAAAFHVLLDEMCSANPAYRSMIEFQALYDARERRRSRTGKSARRRGR